jgi:hypothetical protein
MTPYEFVKLVQKQIYRNVNLVQRVYCKFVHDVVL